MYVSNTEISAIFTPPHLCFTTAALLLFIHVTHDKINKTSVYEYSMANTPEGFRLHFCLSLSWMVKDIQILFSCCYTVKLLAADSEALLYKLAVLRQCCCTQYQQDQQQGSGLASKVFLLFLRQEHEGLLPPILRPGGCSLAHSEGSGESSRCQCWSQCECKTQNQCAVNWRDWNIQNFGSWKFLSKGVHLQNLLEIWAMFC